MMKYHRATSHGAKKIFKCKLCNFNFGNKHSYYSHVNYVHKQPIKEHVCGECNRAFKNRTKLISHVDVVHKKLKEFKCRLCHQRFGYKRSVERHMKNIHGK